MTKIFMQMKRFFVLLFLPFLILTTIIIYLDFNNLAFLKDTKNNKLISPKKELLISYNKTLNNLKIKKQSLNDAKIALGSYIKKHKFKQLSSLFYQLLENDLSIKHFKEEKLNKMKNVVIESSLNLNIKKELFQLFENISSASGALKVLKQKSDNYFKELLNYKTKIKIKKYPHYSRIILYSLTVFAFLSFLLILLILFNLWRRFFIEKNILNTALDGIAEGGSAKILTKLQKMEFIDDLKDTIYHAFFSQNKKLGFTKELINGTDSFKILFDKDKLTQEFLNTLRITSISNLGGIFYYDGFYYFIDRFYDKAFMFKLNTKTLYRFADETVLASKKVNSLFAHSLNTNNLMIDLQISLEKQQKKDILIDIYKKRRKKILHKVCDLKENIKNLKQTIDTFYSETSQKTDDLDLIRESLEGTLHKFSDLMRLINKISVEVEALSASSSLIKEEKDTSSKLLSSIESMKSNLKRLRQDDSNKLDLLRETELIIEGIEIDSDGVLGLNQLVLDLFTKFARLDELEDLMKDLLKSYQDILGGIK